MMGYSACRNPDTNHRLITLLLICFPAVGMSMARAAESVDLVVQVTAITGSCTPLLDTPEINFGSIQYSSLNPSTPTALAEKNVRLTITCSSPMAVGWSISDNRTDSVARFPVTLRGRIFEGTALAGLGKSTAGLPIGNWTVSTGSKGSAQHDGMNGTVIVSTDHAVTWQGSDNVPVTMNFGGGTVTSISETTGTIPVPFSTGNFSLTVGAVIAPRNTLHLADDTRLDGSATISLVYL